MDRRVVDRKKLRERRKRQGLSVAELARRAKVAERTIKYAESRTSTTATGTLVLHALADALGCDIRDITTDATQTAATR